MKLLVVSFTIMVSAFLFLALEGPFAHGGHDGRPRALGTQT